MVLRIDAAPIRRAERTPAGFLRGTANVTRTGVFTYRLPDGTSRRELRHPDEVFREDSLTSLSLAPITLDHPSTPVTASNAKRVTVGTIGEQVTRAGEFVHAPFAVHDEGAIKEIESSRKRELSCGYNCDLELVPGEYLGQAYDAVQRNIVYNHVAVVERGRAGPEVSIRLDAQDAICVDSDRDEQPHNQGNPMTVKFRIDGVDFEVSEQAAQAFKAREEKLAADLAQAKTDAETAKAEAEKAKGRADAADAAVAQLKEQTSPAAIDKRVTERVALVARASKVLGAEFKADGKSDDDIKRAVILKLTPKADLDGKSAEYVSARFDHAIESEATVEDATQSVKGVRSAVSKTDSAPSSADEARQKMIARNRSAWNGTAA